MIADPIEWADDAARKLLDFVDLSRQEAYGLFRYHDHTLTPFARNLDDQIRSDAVRLFERLNAGAAWERAYSMIPERTHKMGEHPWSGIWTAFVWAIVKELDTEKMLRQIEPWQES